MRSIFIIALASLARMTASAPGATKSDHTVEIVQQRAEQSIAVPQKDVELQSVEIRDWEPPKVVAARTTTALQLTAKRGQRQRAAISARQLSPRVNSNPNTQPKTQPSQGQPKTRQSPKNSGTGAGYGDMPSAGSRLVSLINIEVFAVAAGVAMATYVF
ncbi:hypothetical protein MCOR27_008446 [Pyricularia oryzae]|uniref:Uncharacterized protein n=1 Tax=Pyricularia grisea TaxID=148305 RepID=A0ABQ8N4W8_PYRGI|nr:hypothetical protein MCOR01_000433 [Pyricularia oryzae]KAI6289977.1 hypothetical protein MCOR33_011604 [Pyricularia grisea]KAI6253054.1 hypothetical protein MCOR19_010374 [Pyricularia oryzae]KAI6271850.1 hypothetical protein MCOR26_007629 [Pyricularia oryzae]KAI6272209.1 hypothetical protein MCOR27_008446 [Pyricularia oryzae]